MENGLELSFSQSLETSTEERLAIAQQIKRLTLPGEMGAKFKVMALGRGMNMIPSGFGRDLCHSL